MIALVLSFTNISASAPGDAPTSSGSFRSVSLESRAAGADTKSSRAVVKELRGGIADRRLKTWTHQDAVDLNRTRTSYAERHTHSRPYLKWLRQLWSQRAYRAWKTRVKIERLTLRDFAFGPGNDAWPRAVREVQRVFPGTEPWLLSCSDAEGWSPGFDKWVGFDGVPYSTWLRDSNTVGGPMQYRFRTFTGMFRHGLDFVLERGFRVARELRDRSLEGKTRAWRSALGQAIAAGWARYTGNDDSHWSASWGSGC